MKLSEGRIGMFVKQTRRDDLNLVGHITDLSLNCMGDVIFIVKWADPKYNVNDCNGQPVGIHPTNVEPLQ